MYIYRRRKFSSNNIILYFKVYIMSGNAYTNKIPMWSEINYNISDFYTPFKYDYIIV